MSFHLIKSIVPAAMPPAGAQDCPREDRKQQKGCPDPPNLQYELLIHLSPHEKTFFQRLQYSVPLYNDFHQNFIYFLENGSIMEL